MKPDEEQKTRQTPMTCPIPPTLILKGILSVAPVVPLTFALNQASKGGAHAKPPEFARIRTMYLPIGDESEGRAPRTANAIAARRAVAAVARARTL